MKLLSSGDCNSKAKAESEEGTRDGGAMIGYPTTGNTTAPCGDRAEILRGLNNVLAGVLLNAQVMEVEAPVV